MDLKAGNYCGGRKPEDGRINWACSATQIYNLIRGVTHPYPGAFTTLEGKQVVIWSAWPVDGNGEPGQIVSTNPLLVGTGAGLLEIRTLQIDGEKEMAAASLVEAGMPETAVLE
jgi:methionyl-tRNA formyltransferase